MSRLAPETLQLGLIGVIALMGFLILRQAWASWRKRRQLVGRFRRAREGESQARQLLEAHGYAVVASQAPRSYILTLDGAEVQIPLRADYLVTRDGRSYVAEVKTGAFAPQIRMGDTRRQLLEYRMAFDVDGVLLVDAEQQRVHVVRFPLADVHPPASSWLFRFILLGVAAALLVGAQWR